MLALVLIILLALVIGAMVYYVWRQNDDREDQISIDISQSATDSQPNISNEDIEYLAIKEWDAKIPLSDEVSRAYYNFRVDGIAEYVELYDADFDELENTNGVSCGQGHEYQIYSISRVKTEDVSKLNDPAGPEYKGFSFTDQYVFGGLGAHQAPPYCADISKSSQDQYKEDSNIIGIVDEKEAAFERAFEELQSLE